MVLAINTFFCRVSSKICTEHSQVSHLTFDNMSALIVSTASWIHTFNPPLVFRSDKWTVAFTAPAFGPSPPRTYSLIVYFAIASTPGIDAGTSSVSDKLIVPTKQQRMIFQSSSTTKLECLSRSVRKTKMNLLFPQSRFYLTPDLHDDHVMALLQCRFASSCFRRARRRRRRLSITRVRVCAWRK